MNFFQRIIVLFYVTLTLFLGGFLLLFATNWIGFKGVMDILYYIYHDENLKIAFTSLSAALIVINFIFYNMFSVNVHRDKIIAFDNPSGRVTVSLFAMEDLVRRMIGQLAEVRDSKVSISASRKGLTVKIRLVLGSDENIPDVTSQLQAQVTKKIQDTIGIDEPIDVSIYVGKIFLEKPKQGPKNKEEAKKDEKTPPNIPFQGYRA